MTAPKVDYEAAADEARDLIAFHESHTAAMVLVAQMNNEPVSAANGPVSTAALNLARAYLAQQKDLAAALAEPTDEELFEPIYAMDSKGQQFTMSTGRSPEQVIAARRARIMGAGK